MPAVARYEAAIRKTAEVIGDQPIGKLERLGAALYVTKRQKEHHDCSVTGRAVHLNKLEPHIPVDLAQKAVEEIDAMIAQSGESGE